FKRWSDEGCADHGEDSVVYLNTGCRDQTDLDRYSKNLSPCAHLNRVAVFRCRNHSGRRDDQSLLACFGTLHYHLDAAEFVGRDLLLVRELDDGRGRGDLSLLARGLSARIDRRDHACMLR